MDDAALKAIRERHDMAYEDLRSNSLDLIKVQNTARDVPVLLSELEAAQARLDKVAEFIDQRREVITALRNAGTGAQENGDYPRWQGHAEARRVLAEALGIDLDKETGGLARALGLGEEGDE